MLTQLEGLDDETKLEVLQEAIRTRCKSSLYYLAYSVLGYRDINLRTHGRIIRCLESEKNRKLLVCPRGSFKSSIGVAAYSVWRLIRNPNERILIDSEVYENSKNFLREIKGHLESPLMVELFGEFKTRTNWGEGSLTIAQREHNYKESSITCSGVAAQKTGQHYSIVVGDDFNSAKNSGTPEQREKVIQHYRYLQSILDPGGTLVLIGTRYHSRDVYGYVLDEEIAPSLESQGLIV